MKIEKSLALTEIQKHLAHHNDTRGKLGIDLHSLSESVSALTGVNGQTGFPTVNPETVFHQLL